MSLVGQQSLVIFFKKEGGEKETNPLLKQDAWHLADTEQYLYR